jgi:hypothetical protein
MKRIELSQVHYMPSELVAGILYVSEEYNVAGHLCPCGCGSKIITPLGQTEWSFSTDDGRPTLYPSIGNWQLPCRSHYWIINGEIEWSYQWSEKQIQAGRRTEELCRQSYFNKIDRTGKGKRIAKHLVNWFLRKKRN